VCLALERPAEPAAGWARPARPVIEVTARRRQAEDYPTPRTRTVAG
jgi:hypothetical protein